MDGRRSAAWVSGAATAVVGIMLLYVQRRYLSSAGLALIALGTLVLPLAISLALAMPHAPLARVALAVACGVLFYFSITALQLYLGAEHLAVFGQAWSGWIQLALGIVLSPAAVVWAVRPRAWQTGTLRALMGALAIVSLAPLSQLAPAGWDASLLPNVAYGILIMVPPVALAIGLRSVDPDLIEA